MKIGLNFLTIGICFYMGIIIFCLLMSIYSFQIAWKILILKRVYLPYVISQGLKILRPFTGFPYYENRGKELTQPNSLKIIGLGAFSTGIIVLLFTVYWSYNFYQFLSDPLHFILR